MHVTKSAARATGSTVRSVAHLVHVTTRAVCAYCAHDKACDSALCCALFG